MNIIPNDTQIMIIAGQFCKSIQTGQPNFIIDKIARQHCQDMANIHILSHQGFLQRSNKLSQIFPRMSWSEVVVDYYSSNETSLENVAKIFFKGWRNSPRHWQIINSPQTIYSYCITQGSDGTYYGEGLFGKK